MTAQRKSKTRRFTGKRVAVVRRLWRTAEAQVFEVEQRLLEGGQQPDGGERDARTLAVLAKTLRDLATLDEAKPGGKPKARAENSAEHDDPVPTDIDEFRRELARRINALVDSRTGAGRANDPA